MALVAPRRAHGALDLVARAELAAPDLRRRHVHVVARVRERVGPHEAAAVREDVEDPRAGVLGLGLGLGLALAFAFAFAFRFAFRAGPAPRLTGSPLLGSRLRDVVAALGGALVRCAVLAALGAEDRLDQLLAAHAAETFDPELRRDRVQVGQRALLELAAGDYWHGEAPPDCWSPDMRRRMLAAASEPRSEVRVRCKLLAAAQDVPYFEEVHRGGHVVHADDRRTRAGSGGQRGEGPSQTLVRRAAGDRAHEVLAGDRQEDRAAELRQLGEPAQDLDRLGRRLGEVRPRVDHDLLLAHAALAGKRDPLAQEREHVGHHV